MIFRASFYNTYLITCGLPSGDRIPVSVSLSPTKCPSNIYKNIPVQSHPRPSQSLDKTLIGVCLKGLDFMEDRAQHLIEWIEFQLLMGADKIVIYVYSISTQTRKAIEHYVALEKVELVRSLPSVLHEHLIAFRLNSAFRGILPTLPSFATTTFLGIVNKSVDPS